jgi:hypothetical protein
MKWINHCFVGFLFIVTVTHLAVADEVLLENGDKITGKLVRLEKGNLVFSTDYAGEITINPIVALKSETMRSKKLAVALGIRV